MNFKHLHYFWVTAKAGGIMRAGEQLHTTPQTLSGQIKQLERWDGKFPTYFMGGISQPNLLLNVPVPGK